MLMKALWFFTTWTVVSLAMLVWATTDANAVSSQTRQACTSDYLRFCSHTEPGTPTCRACFKSAWRVLSPRCKRAIKRDPAYRSNFR